MYKRLKRTWSVHDLNYLPGFKEEFPELSRVDSEELARRFRKLKLDFFHENKEPVSPLLRLTLPFALLLYILMWIYLPINFILRGTWGYSLGRENRILNWFRSLQLT